MILEPPKSLTTLYLHQLNAPPSSPSSRCLSSSLRTRRQENGWSFVRIDCRIAVLEAVNYLLKSVRSFEQASTILTNCFNECKKSYCELSEFLQERSMPEDHTPLFQATLQANDEDTLKILLLLIKLSAPLTRETLIDIRHACIIRDDNSLFQKLRQMKKYEDGWLSDAEKMHFSMMKARDEIKVTVERQDSGQPGFIVSFTIPMFQKRMRGLGEVVLDFIAQGRVWFLRSDELVLNTEEHLGRMWRLRFSTTVDSPQSARKFLLFHQQKPLIPPNSFQVTLSLMGYSDSTPVQGTLNIPSVTSSQTQLEGEISTKPRSQLVSSSLDKRKHQKHTQSEIKTMLDSMMLASGSMYIAEDGSLSGTLDASLSMVIVQGQEPWPIRTRPPSPMISPNHSYGPLATFRNERYAAATKEDLKRQV
ncbi:hypothetical protein BT96DRAFT_969833 [Gymnopus androsaceus JB14]|uniref:Uncharacterized protein n=1 Tax=Gymnopus androsaceus JB14 TaxID=1447944 RepID=A0A6A4IHP9_9AGAR|nr:hypothetical protein BT96DRAFT_969833 [Gymnopus androsaceus JB14]